VKGFYSLKEIQGTFLDLAFSVCSARVLEFQGDRASEKRGACAACVNAEMESVTDIPADVA
jgi:hypothetical protein